MFKIGHSIGRKILLVVTTVLLIAALLFSISFYMISMRIFDNYVLPEVNSNLKISSNDTYTNLKTSQVLQTKNGNEGSQSTLTSYFDEQVEKFKLHNIYLANVTDDQVVILASNGTSPIKAKQSVAIQSEMKDALKDKTATSELYTNEFGTFITQYIAIPGSTMFIAISMDAGYITEQTQLILWICIGITVLVMLVGLIIAFFSSQSIIRPIVKLAAHSNRLAEGDLQQEITVKGNDEVAQLASSFQRMTHNLKEMIGHVQQTSLDVL